MRICKQVFAVFVLLLSSYPVFAGENGTSDVGCLESINDNSGLVTIINYDDFTGDVSGASTFQKATGENNYGIFDNLVVPADTTLDFQETTSQLQENQNIISKKSLLKSSNAVMLNTSGGSSYASAKAAYYNRVQNALLTMPVVAQAGGYMNQLHSYDEAFHNTDLQMTLPRRERQALRYANQYAVVDYDEFGGYTAYPSAYSPTVIYSSTKRSGGTNGFWFRPYVSTGSVNFKNGPKVDNTMYGVYLGGDSSIKHLKRSEFQYSLYAAYNGSHQSFGKNKVNQNGGLAGITGSWYGENAFAALTVNAGASNADLKTEFVNKNYPMFTAGVSAKTGYNWELADGRFIIQPNYQMSYSFISPFEKGKVAGMSIDSKPLNVLNISPGIKFIGNFESGWQPYAEASFVWSLFDKTKYSTANINIPSISVKPYAQYGIGIQKLWGERSLGFVQFMMRSGGRNEISFNAGYRYAFGK